MTAPSQHAPRWQTAFLKVLPVIQKHVRFAFHHLKGDHRAEAEQEAIANACVAFARLAQQGRLQRAFPSALARFAVRQVNDDRKVGVSQNVRDVMSRLAQRKKKFRVQRLDRFDRDEGEWREAVIQDPRTPILDQVCFRLDFSAWLDTLSRRRRRIALALGAGETTGDVAKLFRVTAGRVSQLRRELHDSWRAFIGEAATN